VEDLTLDPQMAKAISQALNDEDKLGRASVVRQAQGFQKDLESISKREDQAYDHLAAGLLDQEGYRRQIQRLRMERTQTQGQLDQARTLVASGSRETAATIIELSKSAKSLFLSRKPLERRNFLDLVLSNPRLHGVTVEYDLKNTWRLLKEMKQSGEWWSHLEAFRTACSEISAGLNQ
jgi:hypothetical protein